MFLVDETEDGILVLNCQAVRDRIEEAYDRLFVATEGESNLSLCILHGIKSKANWNSDITDKLRHVLKWASWAFSV